MIMGLLRSVGLKWVAIAVGALAVGLISWQTIRWFQQAERDKITIEIQEQTNEKRRRINDAVKIKPNTDPTDATNSLRYLLERQGG